MKKLTFLGLTFLCVLILFSCKTTYTVTTSEPDAKIFRNNTSCGIGSCTFDIYKSMYTEKVRVEKTGFFPDERFLYYEGLNTKRFINIVLIKDDAYDASIKNDYANQEFEQEVDKKHTEEEAWKIISQIVTSYFDNIEMADRGTGYMRTNWQSKSFSKITVRTKIIVKQSSITPLKYKMKIISEYADKPDQSVKDDDKFKEWDRILKKYDGLISEFQSRLGAK